MLKKYPHNTVLLHEAVNALNIKSDGIYIDSTFGHGGHSRLILSKLGKKGRLLIIDRDPQAIKIAESINDTRIIIIHSPFSLLSDYVSKYNLTGKINGILFDLGMSSLQLDNSERGFSFMRDGPLDMRMDYTTGISANKWLMKAKINDIIMVLKNFGEEKYAKRIAHCIVKQNRIKPITRTKQLVDIIKNINLISKKNKHPATRSFQAIRIYINNELEEIKKALNSTINILAPNGRLSIISFHSLEDRIIKHFIHNNSYGIQIPPNLPLTEKQIYHLNKCTLKKIQKIRPSKNEIVQNPRSRSSILRIAQRILM
ncbi:Ribosomal RNA small subunit methyltransferase H [Serratia symbiotica]|nr:Ribosomal RNA small subunit methyltransferase H [Serratia symbiotica]